MNIKEEGRNNHQKLSDLSETALATMLNGNAQGNFPQIKTVIEDSFPYSAMRSAKMGTRLASLDINGRKNTVYIQANGNGISFGIKGIGRKETLEWIKGESCDLPNTCPPDHSDDDQLILKVEPADKGLVVTAQAFGFHFINGEYQLIGDEERVEKMEKPDAMAHFIKQLKNPFSER